ncbi:ribosome-associated protein [Xanthomonas arboricola]|uniref:ribosome biogenesis factor YjgA n=1 Tax=Xanthomonas euroxanthea TaxID=2259622 RepID=UPI001609827B|nr:ribosome biogenesis factor YjgA [Xanthomonas euroxanthea]MBB3813861.1 ribosome-associated protein [Xanthomonas euroxanthea]
MRGRDEETGEFRGASRSQQRREALEIFDLGEKLVALTPAQLAKLPVPESLIPHIEESKRITSHIAHKRQLAFLAKHMRREDDETLAAIRDALDANSDTARREVAAIHRVERWRERLLAEGDVALAELLEAYPAADRQQLRQLVRNAIHERAKNKPPRAYRELFQVLRELFQVLRELSQEQGVGSGDSGLEDDQDLEDDE